MVSAIIVAGGKGTRMNGKTRKQFLPLEGLPILSRTLFIFDTCDEIDRVFLVVPEEELDYSHTNILLPINIKKEVQIIAGGPRRQDSVYNGLVAVKNEAPDSKKEIVVIHDGVRPFVKRSHITACIDGARKDGACALGIPAEDTLKQADTSGFVETTIRRDGIWLAQTPQAFELSLLLKAHEDANQEGYTGTDDASLVERLGKRVKIIPGSKFNIKITTREDLQLARAIFECKLP